MMIYADNAATTKISPAAKQAMLDCMEEYWGNPSSLYTLGQKASSCLLNARETIATCLGAAPGEIYFTSGGSESDNQAILSAAHSGAAKGKKHLISTGIEHHAVLRTLEHLGTKGFDITLLPVGTDGILDARDVAAAIRPDTALVTVMSSNNEIGTLQPIEEISRICREKGVIFHTDAVQSAGHLPVDVRKSGMDMLSLSAHKFHGPRGVGVLYVRKGIPLEPLIYGGSQERGKRAGTENLPAIAGMAAALKEATERLDSTIPYVTGLRNQLIEGLSEIPGSRLNGCVQSRLPGNVSFCFDNIEGEMLLLLLNQRGIAASSGSACASGSLEPSHVLRALGYSPELAKSALRLTLSESNTKEEIAEIIKNVREIVEYLRNI
ncbi:MAG: cysteine desulfurase family protein [Eubacteriales bacterium]|nr:cysteine desulfurase family protein [Eubacteriales bacterium]